MTVSPRQKNVLLLIKFVVDRETRLRKIKNDDVSFAAHPSMLEVSLEAPRVNEYNINYLFCEKQEGHRKEVCKVGWRRVVSGLKTSETDGAATVSPGSQPAMPRILMLF